MRLRDAVEQAVRAWHAHETARGGRLVIDFDCAPAVGQVQPALSRLDICERLTTLHERAVAEGDAALEPTLRAHLAYLRHVLGERPPVEEYIRNTQGCAAAGWSPDYVAAVGDRARVALADLGIGWGPTTMTELNELEGHIELAEAKDRVLAVAAQAEPNVRALAGTSAPYSVTIEIVDIDDYWAYWLDGAGSDVRLRLNLRQAVFTRTRLEQFAQHELLGHALQGASYAQAAATVDVPWSRLLTVHLPYQVCLEGLATALPLFVTPNDAKLAARTRLDHYVHLVRAELHLAINNGVPAAVAATHARRRIPYWDSNRIANELSDRGADPMLRSYLWSYPAGTDWFINLADHADTATIEAVFRAAYQRPLTPADLTQLWPDGPPIGGNLATS